MARRCSEVERQDSRKDKKVIKTFLLGLHLGSPLLDWYIGSRHIAVYHWLRLQLMIHLLLFFFYNVSIKCAVGRGPIPINNQELCVVFFLCFCLCVIKASVLEAGRGFPGGWSSCSTCLLRAYTSTDLPASPLSSASTSASTTQYHEPQLHHEPYHLP